MYGRFEVRARIPVGKGAWPAIWTLGSSMEWPSCGEIDIMEFYRKHGIPHILANAAWGTDRQWNAKWNSKAIPFIHFLEKNSDWASEFHIWRMDWDEEAIRLYLDDELLNEILLKDTYNGSIGSYKNPFMQPQYILLNLAVGGINGGEVEINTYPIRYEIDYVRVYQKNKIHRYGYKKIIIGLCLGIYTFCGCSNEPLQPIRSGEIWPDNNGEHINAHGGGVMYHDGTYYWFGENKCDTTSSAMVGVMCYSSRNLTDWKNEGVALSVVDNDSSDIARGCILERPKVIYNAKTGKFVMWFHLELKGKGYAAARAGVAVSDTPAGPYRFIRSGRVNAGKLPVDMDGQAVAVLDTLNAKNYEKWWTPEWTDAVNKGLIVKRDLDGGQMSRDMTLYVDEDGKAYHIYSSEENLTLQIAELSDDYLSHTGNYVRVAPAGHNEAPAIFKKDGTYWMITSGCTGWAPNEARMFSSSSIFGPWSQHPNPCVGPKSELTFGGQSTYILKVEGKKDAFIFMADIWRPEHPSDARYIWLPVQFKEGIPYVEWMDNWTLDFFQ